MVVVFILVVGIDLVIEAIFYILTFCTLTCDSLMVILFTKDNDWLVLHLHLPINGNNVVFRSHLAPTDFPLSLG